MKKVLVILSLFLGLALQAREEGYCPPEEIYGNLPGHDGKPALPPRLHRPPSNHGAPALPPRLNSTSSLKPAIASAMYEAPKNSPTSPSSNPDDSEVYALAQEFTRKNTTTPENDFIITSPESPYLETQGTPLLNSGFVPAEYRPQTPSRTERSDSNSSTSSASNSSPLASPRQSPSVPPRPSLGHDPRKQTVVMNGFEIPVITAQPQEDAYLAPVTDATKPDHPYLYPDNKPEDLTDSQGDLIYGSSDDARKMTWHTKDYETAVQKMKTLSLKRTSTDPLPPKPQK